MRLLAVLALPILISSPILLSGCLLNGDDATIAQPIAPSKSFCVEDSLSQVTHSTGKAWAFHTDPIIDSGIPHLGPTSHRLDEFRKGIELSRLGGRGVLEGIYADIRDGLSCGEGFGAYSESNEFHYSQRDDRFQQAMAYYHTDRFRELLDRSGYLGSGTPLRVVAPCPEIDNAYYTRRKDETGMLLEKICLGISLATPGANYGDDASVTVHELQHATTANSYSLEESLGTLFYDEAGALNEAVSDFMALMYLSPAIPASPASPASNDPRVFGRWALGTFIPGRNASRGAHRCPSYDPDFPNCRSFPSFSAQNNTASYVYPDGLGWPYPKSYPAPSYLRSTFEQHRYQEEIHNNAPILAGALWDAYEAARLTGSETDINALQEKFAGLVMEAIRNLPKPTAAERSPVTFRGFAELLTELAPLSGFSSAAQAAITQALTERGLYGGATLPAGWAAIDATEPYRILDNPSRLKTWLMSTWDDPESVKQGIETGLNGKLDPGETVALWFNLRNTSAITAGGVQLSVRSLSPHVTFLKRYFKTGWVTENEAQIQYFKVNGTAIVSALAAPGNPSYQVPTGSEYFKTNPHFDGSHTTAIWVVVAADIPRGSIAQLEVKATPSNGAPTTLTYSIPIQ